MTKFFWENQIVYSAFLVLNTILYLEEKKAFNDKNMKQGNDNGRSLF